MADWNISPRSSHCTNCKKVFEPGESAQTQLFKSGKGEIVRRDLCKQCAQQEPLLEGFELYSFWTFHVPHAQKSSVAAKSAPIKHETAEHLFRTLIEKQDPNETGVIYLLAILMVRSKQLVERELVVNEDGQRHRIYEQKKTGDLFNIIEPVLSEINIEEIQKRIVAYLDGNQESPTTNA